MIEQAARHFGMNNAADMFRRYLDRVGGTVSFRPEELRRYPVVQDAERGIQQYFMDWIGKPRVEKTVVPTKAGPVVQMTESKVKRIGDDLVGMKDGQTITRSDYWDRKFQYPGFSFGIETFTGLRLTNPWHGRDLAARAGLGGCQARPVGGAIWMAAVLLAGPAWRPASSSPGRPCL